MKYAEPGGMITITMDYSEFANLLFLIGYAGGLASKEANGVRLRQFFDLANDLNNGNPHWQKYETEGLK